MASWKGQLHEALPESGVGMKSAKGGVKDEEDEEEDEEEGSGADEEEDDAKQKQASFQSFTNH